MTMAEYSKVKTSVWWDIENCEVPKGWDAHAIAQNLGSALLDMNYCGPVSILAYGDTNLIPHHVQQALSSTGVGLNHVPAGIFPHKTLLLSLVTVSCLLMMNPRSLLLVLDFGRL